jgi:hypothetical protein
MTTEIIYPKPVIPRKHQVDHFRKCEEVLSKEYLFEDRSPTGYGKTYPPLFIAQKYNCSLFVVCPHTIEDKWREVAVEYGIRIEAVLSYNSLRGTSTNPPKHGYLQLNTGNEGKYTATNKLQDCIKRGTIFVFDEAHNLKNKSLQSSAASAVIREISNTANKSRYFLISATLFDKMECCINFMEVIGIKKSRNMYTFVHGVLNYLDHGLGEIIEYGKRFDKELVEEILTEHKVHRWNAASDSKFKLISDKVAYDIMLRVVKNKIGGSMEKPRSHCTSGNIVYDSLIPYLIPDIVNIVYSYYQTKDRKNGYYKVAPDVEENIKQSIRGLSKAVGFNPDEGKIDQKSFGRATKHLTILEVNKVNIFTRLSRENLNNDPLCKVILFVHFLDTIEKLEKELKDYNPLVLCGATKKRDVLLDKFQKDDNYRLLICTASTGGIGTNLHDTIGGRTRYSFMSPTYSIILGHQTAGRTDRDGALSDPHFRFVYAKIIVGGMMFTEIPILTAMARKTAVLKSINDNGDQLYPGDYEDDIEE